METMGRILIFAIDRGTGDTIEFQANREGGFDVELDAPWAGDSDRGFGITSRVSLNRDQATSLRDWLSFHLDTTP